RLDTQPPYRRRVNTVFQHYALFPHMTVEQNVGYGLAIAKRPTAEIESRVAEALKNQRWTAATHRPSPCLGKSPAPLAARRATLRARRQPAPPNAGRTQSPAARGRHHLHLRHPRPGRS